MQNLDPAAVPGAVTAAASPPDFPGPPGGPAPYNIAAPQDIGGITAAFESAIAVAAAGVLYPRGPRQAEAAALLDSPQGGQAVNVLSGFDGFGSTDVGPGANSETPVQGDGTYPGTTQDGLPVYGM